MDRLFFKYLAPLLAISIIPILAIVLLLFFFIRSNITELENNLIYQNTETLKREISYKNQAIAKTEGMFIEQEIEKISNQLIAMELEPDFLNLETEKINAFAENIMNKDPSIIEINIIDRWGDIIFQKVKSMSLETEQPLSKDLQPIYEYLHHHDAYLSSVEYSNQSELPLVTMGRPFKDYAGHVIGGIIIKMDLGFIREIVADQQVGEKGVLYIISNKGVLISHPSLKEFQQNPDYSKYEYVQQILAQKNGTLINEDNLVSFYTNKYDWTTIIEVPMYQALASVEENKRTISSFISATLRSISYFTVLIILFGLLLATLAAIFISKRIMTPIANFAHAMRRISEGELSLQLEKHSNDEIGELTDSFNKMTEELRKEREALIKSNESIQKPTKSPDRESSMEETSTELQEIEKPLRSIRDYLEEVKGKSIETEVEVEDAIKDIEQIDFFLKDLLQHSEISTKTQDLEKVDFLKVFEEVVEDLKEDIQKSNANIKCSHLPKIKALRSSIFQLFHHLISNAIQYKSGKSLEILVSASEKDDHWQFSVKDNGVGIDPKKMDEVFKVAEYRDNGHMSYSFGLAMCKNIVERHGGKIWVESTPEKGSSFFFTIKKYV